MDDGKVEFLSFGFVDNSLLVQNVFKFGWFLHLVFSKKHKSIEFI